MKTLILSLMVVFFIVLFSWGAKAIPEESLVLYLPFDEGAGDTARDISPNRHTGTLIGDGVKWTIEGKFGRALEFNGVDGHVNVADHDSLSLDEKKGGSFTIMAWIFPKVVDRDFRWIVDKSFVRDGASSYRLGIQNKNQIAFSTRKRGVDELAGPEIKPETWYHIAGVQDEKTAKQVILYVDGVAEAQIPVAGEKIVEKETDLKIGARNWAGGDVQQFFKGVIDEVAIFNVALTPDELKEAMKGLKRIFAVNPSGKLAVIWADIKARN